MEGDGVVFRRGELELGSVELVREEPRGFACVAGGFQFCVLAFGDEIQDHHPLKLTMLPALWDPH